MALRNAKPITIRPKGVSDALDGTNSFKGAMLSLSNLIPDITTQDLFVPRPASIELTDLDDADGNGFISSYIIIGNIVYGMVASQTYPTFDVPFAYDIENDSFITVSGIASDNIPSSPPATGTWTPPFMDLISTDIIVAHAGFDGTGTNFFGVIDISSPASPAWSSSNTGTNGLPSVPTVVKNFNNRAYFACGNYLYFSDVLVPTTMTNATNFLVLGDTTPIVALANLALNTLLGGASSSLIAFKNALPYQVTGDLALNDLTLAPVPAGVGTYAPLSVANTPKGIAFIAPDGLRMIDLIGNVTDPIGADGDGVSVPFITANVPSRISAAYNVDTLRISDGTSEYWFNVNRKAWTGPHTFPASLIAGYMESFILAPIGVTNSLWQSDILVNSTSIYTENDVDLQFEYQTCLMPDTDLMAANSVIESAVTVAFQITQGSIYVSFLDENQSVINTINIMQGGSTTVWDAFTWGSDPWLGSTFDLQQIRIPWTIPIVFKQGYVRITGPSFFGFKIGNLYLKYQPLGYLLL